MDYTYITQICGKKGEKPHAEGNDSSRDHTKGWGARRDMGFRMMRLRAPFMILACALVGLSACVSPMVEVEETREGEAVRREEIVQQGMGLVGSRDLSIQDDIYRNDCSGFVVGVYRSLGYDVDLEYYDSSFVAENLFRNLRARGHVYTGMRPKKADLAFFKNTVENSGSRMTHVGLVADVDQEETVLIIQYTSKGVSLMRMNLQTPGLHMDKAGNVFNDFLRKKPPSPGDVQLLSGELFFMYGDLYSFIMN